jgi:mannan endo-1,4-beta-mannosidase
MLKRIYLSILLILGFTSIFSQELPGFRVMGRNLYDHCGEKVILRGVSNPNIWFQKDGGTNYAEIKKTGANVIRIVWQTSGSSTELDKAIENCRDLNMIPMVELHDATGDWSKLQQCIDYWTRDDIVEVIQKHEQYLLINIANEVGNSTISNSTFFNDYSKHVNSMREAGIHVPLIIDGTDWGKNITILQSEGLALIESDPDHNLMFSVHMWWPKMYGYTENSIVTEIAESVKMNLPLIVGEFSQMHGSCDDKTITSNNSIPYQTILRECTNNQVGYIAWSWFGNCNSLWDMTTDGTFRTLYSWGLDVAVENEYSIQKNAKRPYSLTEGGCNAALGIENLSSLGEKTFLRIYPNPLTDKGIINYTIGGESPVEIALINQRGEKIWYQNVQEKVNGEFSFNFDSSNLPGGLYLCTLSAGSTFLSEKILIIHQY